MTQVPVQDLPRGVNGYRLELPGGKKYAGHIHMKNTARFDFPEHIQSNEQLRYCLEIIGKLRRESTPLRKENSSSKNMLCRRDEKINNLQTEISQLKRSLKNANYKIKELENLLQKKETTTNRYRVALFDSGNFSTPGKKKKKPKGGQEGHSDTNRESQTDAPAPKAVRIYAKKCGGCGTQLNRVNSTRKKRLIDINLNPKLVNLLYESERQWCPCCQKEVCAKSSRSLPFTEYGINIFMFVMILRFRGNQSMGSISETADCLFNLELSKSSINNLLVGAKTHLNSRYEQLKQYIREDKIMYNDETGWKVAGKSAWVWIMANDKHSVYVAAESRGKGIMEEMYGDSNAFSMHDGYGAYINTVPKDKQLKCWAHVLRFAYEETHGLKPKSHAVKLRKRLVNIYQLKRKKDKMAPDDFEVLVNKKLDAIVRTKIDEEDEPSRLILVRIENQKLALARSLTLTKDGTNNLSERELRGLANIRKISYGSNTFEGMEVTTVLASVVQSIHRDKDSEMIPSLNAYLCRGIQSGKRGSQYSHRAYYDSS